MSSIRPLVSIVTLNYNQSAITYEFLESTRRLTYPRYEILVCDMASPTDPVDPAKVESFPHARCLLSAQNLGFAAGNNWGIRQAAGEFIFIVNNDTELTDSLLESLLAPFTRDAAIGVTCPKIKYFYDQDLIQYAGFNPINARTGRTSARGSNEKDQGQYDQSGITHGAHGCAMMVKREVIDKVGMFPEKFFLYYEEWDWSARIQKANYKIWYVAEATVYHKGSASVGKNSPMKVYYHTRNRILYMRRNSKPGDLAIFTLFFVLLAVPKSVIKYTLTRQFGNLRSFIRGAVWNLSASKYSPV
jgi:GT2 family glycosyltransferase